MKLTKTLTLATR